MSKLSRKNWVPVFSSFVVFVCRHTAAAAAALQVGDFVIRVMMRVRVTRVSLLGKYVDVTSAKAEVCQSLLVAIAVVQLAAVAAAEQCGRHPQQLGRV